MKFTSLQIEAAVCACRNVSPAVFFKTGRGERKQWSREIVVGGGDGALIANA